MTRRYRALGGTFAAMPLSFAGLNFFEGNRLAQSCVMLGYVAIVLLLTCWGNRARAG
jgi:hypothetical protein